jgi:two-component system, OmpR family, response regulator
MASGAAAYLTKPFRPKELRELALQLCPAPVSQAPHISGKSLC